MYRQSVCIKERLFGIQRDAEGRRPAAQRVDHAPQGMQRAVGALPSRPGGDAAHGLVREVWIRVTGHIFGIIEGILDQPGDPTVIAGRSINGGVKMYH